MGKMNDEDYWRYRTQVYAVMGSCWGVRAPDSLADLLGYPDVETMCVLFNARDREVCKALAGPHGYALYKATLARREAENE